jgi:predicted O-linked N-acetylglucosamine transferase (SPINDLY family)
MDFLNRVQELINSENYSEAIAILDEAIEVDSEDLSHRWNLGLIYLLKEDEKTAIETWLLPFLTGTLEEIKQWTVELIEFLEIQVQENILRKRLGNAKIIYEAIFIIDPDYENSLLLNELVEALSYLATGLSHQNERETAIAIYLEILNLNPNHAISYHSLALNYYYLEKYQEAEESIEKAIDLDNSLAINYHVLGLILEKLDKQSSAIQAYQKSIQLDCKFIESYKKLAKLFILNEQINESIVVYKNLLDVVPSTLKASIYHDMAIAYQRSKNQLMIDYYSGCSAYYNKQINVACQYFENFLKNNGQSDYQNINYYIKDAYVKLGRCYTLTDQPKKATKLIEEALNFFPGNLALQRVNQSILPIIYETQDEIKFYRNRFSSLLKELIENLKLDTQEDEQDALMSVQICTNFYLGYHGENDLKIQQDYGCYIYEIAKKIYPQWCQKVTIDKNISRRRIRVGYISLHLHSLGTLYLGWLKHTNTDKFETFVYDISGYDENDDNQNLSFRNNFRIYSEHISFISGEIDDICLAVMNNQIDILIFTEIGLDPKISLLSCLRLAPIQCTTWCHPITSGSPNIDYFLSSDLMEPTNAQEHYSEILVRLPNLAFSIEPFSFAANDKRRADFQLQDDSVIYLCCQTLFKYLPQHDYIFPSIAQENPLAKFVFFDPFLGSVITEKFKKRIEKVFDKYNLHYEQYCIFLNKLSLVDYIKLNQLADIFLDSFGWSGGFSTKDAISQSLPVVTCPGAIMRARQSYGMLNMIGVTETIAKDEADYIKIAIRLGLDDEWRQAIKNKMAKNKHRLFNDLQCIKALEKFFTTTIQEKRKET